jgi:hypothetical protein
MYLNVPGQEKLRKSEWLISAISLNFNHLAMLMEGQDETVELARNQRFSVGGPTGKCFPISSWAI